MVKGLEHSVALEQDPALDSIRQRLGDLVLGKLAVRNGKHVVELFESALLRLGYEEEDHDKRYEVEAGVQAKCTDGV